MMRFLLTALFLWNSVNAFVVGTQGDRRHQTSSVMFMSASPPEDFMKRSQKVKTVLEDDEKPPKLFEDDLLDDMQQSLLTLDKRVKEGPGSLTKEEVDEFEAATQRILTEMKEFNASGGSSPGSSAPASPPAASTCESHVASNPADVATPMPLDPRAAQSTSQTLQPGQTVVRTNQEVTDTSLDEGPAYDGSGGMGLAKGTANTYIIPGMDEMSPEEYRAALQKSVIDRQSKRHSGRQGMVGNRAAHQYLDSLGWGGASSNLSGKKSAQDDEEPK
jgi:hypothetical protein